MISKSKIQRLKYSDAQKLMCFLIFFICNFSYINCDILSSNKYSPFAKLYYYNSINLAKNTQIASTKTQFQTRIIDGQIYLPGFLKIDTNCAESLNSILSYTKIRAKYGDIYTVLIRSNNLGDIENNDCIQYFQLDENVKPNLNVVRQIIGADDVQNGNGLKQAYTGKNVIVGIIDGGFDFNHPSFLNSDGSSRILSYWNQQKNWNSPEIFGYGDETTGSDILNLTTDTHYESHGTHVMGIAAGADNLSNFNNYRGIAPEADLVPVSFDILEIQSTGNSTILDAINYVFKIADKKKKPSVVNMSLGLTIGPHDGTSLFDIALDRIAGQGKIVVGAAGNCGDSRSHLGLTFDNLKNDYITMTSLNHQVSDPYLDIWGLPDKEICLNFGYKYKGKVYFDSTSICTSNNKLDTTKIILPNQSYFQVITTSYSSEFNGKTRIFVYFKRSTIMDSSIVMRIRSNDNTVHLWNCGDGGSNSASSFDFVNDSTFTQSISVEGDNNTTVTEIGGSGKSVITVGSFVSSQTVKNYIGKYIYNYDGSKSGELSLFSSKGPSTDGRLKPEINAPGSLVVSSVNNYDQYFQLGGEYATYLVNKYPGITKANWFAAMEGTSMAAPVVTGAIALLLEVNPKFTKKDILEIFRRTAIQDGNTGVIPYSGSNDWGFGKINIFRAAKLAENFIPFSELSKFKFSIYPNPSSINKINLESKDTIDIFLEVQIYDYIGNLVKRKSIGKVNWDELTLDEFPEGIYFVRIVDLNNSSNYYNTVFVKN